MEHNDKYKVVTRGVKRQQPEKKLNALTRTKNDNSKIVINDQDTQCSTVQDSTKKLRNDQMDSKPNNGSDKIDVSKHSLDNNGESSKTGCDNINNLNTPTDTRTRDDILNEFVVNELVKQLLHPHLPKLDVTFRWPIIIMLRAGGSITVSQQEFEDIIIEKTEKLLNSQIKSALEMINVSTCKEEKYSWYKKYKESAYLRYSIKDKIVTLHAKRNSQNAAVGTSENMPENNNPAKDNCKVDPRFFPF